VEVALFGRPIYPMLSCLRPIGRSAGRFGRENVGVESMARRGLISPLKVWSRYPA
jgi:hypothetical protein